MPPTRSAISFVFIIVFGIIPLNTERSTAPAQSFAALCNTPANLCVSSSLVRSQISNPLDFNVMINSPDQIYVAWEVADSTGQILESNSSEGFLLPVTSTNPSRKTLHIKDYFVKPAKSDTGVVTFTPSRWDPSTGLTALPPLKIPVRLPTARTDVTFLLPQDKDAFLSEVAAYMNDENHKEFSPKTPFTPHTVTIMHLDPSQIPAAAAEAAARAWPGQSPFHVIDSHVDGDTAHLTINGEGWAGVSFYLTGLNCILTRTVLALPGIKHIVFDQPPAFSLSFQTSGVCVAGK